MPDARRPDRVPVILTATEHAELVATAHTRGLPLPDALVTRNDAETPFFALLLTRTEIYDLVQALADRGIRHEPGTARQALRHCHAKLETTLVALHHASGGKPSHA